MQIGRGQYMNRAELGEYRRNSDKSNDTKVEKRNYNTVEYHRAIISINGEGPISSIIAHRDAASANGNYIMIELAKGEDSPKFTEQESARLGELGATPGPIRRDTGKCSVLEVGDYRDTHTVIDWLFRHRYITEVEKNKVDSCLRELSIWAVYAETDPIAIQQMQQLISKNTEPYINALPDHTTAAAYFSSMVETILNYNISCGDQDTLNEWKSVIIEDFRTAQILEDEEFSDPLYLLACIYIFPALLHELFDGVPRMDDTVVQKIIWDSIIQHKKTVQVAPAEPTEEFYLSTSNLTYKVQNKYLKI